MNCFMGEGGAEDIDATDAAPAAGQGTQGASTIPDGMLSLIAPGLFSNLIIQPQQPACGRRGGRKSWRILPEAAFNPLNALPPAHQARAAPVPPAFASSSRPMAPLPILRPRGSPRSRVKVNPPPMAVRDGPKCRGSDQRGRPREAGGRRQGENRGPAGREGRGSPGTGGPTPRLQSLRPLRNRPPQPQRISPYRLAATVQMSVKPAPVKLKTVGLPV